MTSRAYPPICASCQRYQPFDADHDTAFCEAFPDGIPDRILDGDFDHRQPFDGDHGIRYLAAPGPQAAKLLALYEQR